MISLSLLQKEIQWLIQEKYQGATSSDLLRKDIVRLLRGEPIDYVIGFSHFLGCCIDLSSKPFIPRSETEYWVGKAINTIQGETPAGKTIRCLDMFAGSGCIGIAVLNHVANARVDFIESDAQYSMQIKINAKLNAIAPYRFRIIQSNIFQNVEGRYDYLFANPPYCVQSMSERVEHSVTNFEPANAIWGGEDGLFYIKKFLEEVPSYLKRNGTIYLEFDDIQKGEIEKLIRKREYRGYQFHKDQFGLWRYVEIAK